MQCGTRFPGMLSRVAESVYWMSRYVERAENVSASSTSISTCRSIWARRSAASGRRWSIPRATTSSFWIATAISRKRRSCSFSPSTRKTPIRSCPACARPRERPHGSRNHFVRHVGRDQQVLLDGQRGGGRAQQAALAVRFFQSDQTLEPHAAGRDRRHDVARRSLALRPHRPAAGASRQDLADPGRQVFRPVAHGFRRGHSAGYRSSGRRC